MYEPPKTDLRHFEPISNACPKCQTPVRKRDYTKFTGKRANRVTCRACGSLLRYNMNRIEVAILGMEGLVAGVGPAFLFWPFVEFKTVLYYLVIVGVLVSAVDFLEFLYVRKFKKVELIVEGDNES